LLIDHTERASEATDLVAELTGENKLLNRRLERERRIRHEAEQIAEHGLRDLYQKQRDLEFLSTITTLANQAGSTREVLAAALEHICNFIGWPAAHAYIAGGDGADRRMWPSDIWYHTPGLDLSELQSATAALVCVPGQGLPGQVWESGEPVWLADLATCGNFPRRKSALRSGMRVAFSAPLLIRSEVVGSLEFLGPYPTQPDPGLLELIAKVGTQLGRVIERDTAEALLHDTMNDLSIALEDSRRAQTLLRANTDALADPQVLFEGMRNSGGRVVDLVYRDVNSATCTYLGLSREQLIGHSCLETLPNIEGSGLLAHYVRCAESGEQVVLDDFPYHNELLGDFRYYDIRGANAGPGLISLTWRDVTDRVEVGHVLAESEERFRLLAENAGDVVVHVRDNRFVWVSPSVVNVLGAPPEYWLGRETEEIIPADDKLTHASRVQEIRQGPFIGQARVVAIDGSTHWVHAHAKPFYDADGHRDGVVTAFRLIDDEVAQRRQMTQALLSHARADERYRKLMENSPIGMCLVTPDGHFEAVNQALCDFFGYDAGTLRNKTWLELTAADYLDADLAKVEDVLAGRIDSYRIIKQFINSDGVLIWGDLSVSCLRNASGTVENFLTQVTDITAEVAAREQVSQRDRQNRVLTQRLQSQSNRLTAELRSAASYVASILPGELTGTVRVSSRYLPSRELGGDSYDYRWIDDDHLIVHLIDISGHGIEPSLLSISVHNMLRSGSLPTATLLEPDRILGALNEQFQMDQQRDHYFTMWYGVYEASTRTLRYASAGHPPVLAFEPGGPTPIQLSTVSYPVGMFPDTTFSSSTVTVPPGTRVLLYSDGAFDLPLPKGKQCSLAGFVDLCTDLAESPDWSLDELITKLRSLTVAGLFSDDCSLVLLNFD
jgi:sigma-B regulation protein RsbU (phosphoserine phosphatase)